jgi:hypothetical protein
MGGWFLSRKDSTIVARHKVPYSLDIWRGALGVIYAPKVAIRLSPFGLWGEALRAWQLSACPSGTKAILPSKCLRIVLTLMAVCAGNKADLP